MGTGGHRSDMSMCVWCVTQIADSRKHIWERGISPASVSEPVHTDISSFAIVIPPRAPGPLYYVVQ